MLFLPEKMKKYANVTGVYLIVCLSEKSRYVGSSSNIGFRLCRHYSDLNRNKHHNSNLQQNFNNYKAQNFRFRILEQVDSLSDYLLRKAEKKWLDLFVGNKIKTMNLADPMNGNAGKRFKRNYEFREKMRQYGKENLMFGFENRATFKGQTHTLKARKKISDSHLGFLNGAWEKKVTSEHKMKIALSLLGVKKSDEHCKKISESKKGKPNGHEGMKYSDEWRQNISKSLKGKTSWAKGARFTEEHRSKISQSHKGKKLRESSIEKIKEARKKQKMPKWTPERLEKFKKTWEKKRIEKQARKENECNIEN